MSLQKGLKAHAKWPNDFEHRLLIFRYVFPESLVVLPTDGGFVAKSAWSDDQAEERGILRRGGPPPSRGGATATAVTVSLVALVLVLVVLLLMWRLQLQQQERWQTTVGLILVDKARAPAAATVAAAAAAGAAASNEFNPLVLVGLPHG